jgi:hypothetical protein
MNWEPESGTPNSSSATSDTSNGSASAAAEATSDLFPGDTGELAFETRRVLVQLLLGPSVDGRRHGRMWPILLRDEMIVRRRLHELFLDLVVDRDHQVAFTRQVQTDEIEIPVLLRRSPLSFLDSVLLLFLRQRLTHAEAQGDRAVVSVDEMIEHMSLFERQLNTDKAGFERRMRNSIDKMKHDSVLQKIRNSEDRFEVSPTLRLLFSAEEVIALTQIYRSFAGGAQVSNSAVGTKGSTNEDSDIATDILESDGAGDEAQESV